MKDKRFEFAGSGWTSDGGRFFKVVNGDGEVVGEIVGSMWRWSPDPISGQSLKGLRVEGESPAGALDALNQILNKR